jgi:hypothetical protein
LESQRSQFLFSMIRQQSWKVPNIHKKCFQRKRKKTHFHWKVGIKVAHKEKSKISFESAFAYTIKKTF